MPGSSSAGAPSHAALADDMKRLRPFLMILLLVACGGGGDPVTPPPAKKTPLKVTGGTFVVTATQTFDNCDMATVWDGTYEVQIDSTIFSMGQWTGTWDAKTHAARGDSPKDVTQTRACTVTRWSSVYITFSTPDHFAGSVVYRLRLGGDCGDRKTCSSSWTIVGNRQ